MALSMQNLFCSGSEDFDDEEFLCALEDTESCFSSSHSAPFRLRPIPDRDGQAPGGLSVQQTVPTLVEQRPKDTASTPALTQDVDDDELLSVCSEVESGVSQELCQTPGPRLRPSNWTSQQSSTHTSCSPKFQLRPTLGQRTFNEGLPVTGHIQPQPYRFHTASSLTSDFSQNGRGRGHCQSPSPSAKRPCLRSTLESQPVTPVRPSPHLAQSGYPRCTTPTGPPWQGGLASNAPPQPRTPQMSSRPHQPSTLQTPVVTNHLVQLVTAANKTPQKLTWETPPPKERRFPGPAGLLPQQGSVRRLDEILVSPPHTPSHGARARARSKENVASQQPVGEEYGKGPWASMKAELLVDESDPACFLRTYSVVMVLRKAALKQLPKNKVPQMAVALKSLTPANGDASAVFGDATGEIQGTVHHLLLEERESELKVGSVLLLQQVGVFSPSHRNHYLNVTPSNLVKIYATGEGGPKVPVAVMTPEKVDINSNQTQPRCSQQAFPSSSSSNVQPEVSRSVTSQPPGSTARAHQPILQPPVHAPLSSTAHPRVPHPVSLHAPLPSTAHPRVPHPASLHAPLPSTEHPRVPHPVSPHAPLPSTAHPRVPHPASLHAPLPSTSHPRIPHPTIHQTKASAPWSSTGQPRTVSSVDSGDWEMDDLDSLLSDLPEDPGD